jgi:hypothetical protein
MVPFFINDPPRIPFDYALFLYNQGGRVSRTLPTCGPGAGSRRREKKGKKSQEEKIRKIKKIKMNAHARRGLC